MPIGPYYLRWPFRWPFRSPIYSSEVQVGQAEISPSRWASDDEVLQRYQEGLGRAVLAVKSSVGRQKSVVYRRWVHARWWMFAISATILTASTAATIFGAFGLSETSLTGDLSVAKIMRVALPSLIGLLVALETLFDTRGRYVREAEAQLSLTRLQSDIEYALVWDMEQKTDKTVGDRYRVTFDTVDAWREKLNSILDSVSKEYISANSKAASRKGG
jgi:hypothetical protein